MCSLFNLILEYKETLWGESFLLRVFGWHLSANTEILKDDYRQDPGCRVPRGDSTSAIRFRSPLSSVSKAHVRDTACLLFRPLAGHSVLLGTSGHVSIYFLNPEFSLSFDSATY